MKELLQRSLFGLIYALVVILSLQSYGSTALLLALFLIVGLKEFSRMVQIDFTTVLLPSIFIYLTAFLYHDQSVNDKVLQIAFGFSLLVLFVPLLYFIFNKLDLEKLSKSYVTIVYISIPFALALQLDSKLLLSVFFIIWASDSFAYLTGKNFGKHKLAEKISPKKTVEGVVGGLLGSMLVAYLIFHYSGWITMLKLPDFLILTTIIVIFGTLGDLLESRFKRLANIKDSGNVIPGHGGILDRLDSFILAIPFVFIFLLII